MINHSYPKRPYLRTIGRTWYALTEELKVNECIFRRVQKNPRQK